MPIKNRLTRLAGRDKAHHQRRYKSRQIGQCIRQSENHRRERRRQVQTVHLETGLSKAWKTRGHGQQRHRRHPVTAHVPDRDQRHCRHRVAQGVEEFPHRGGGHDAALSQPVGGVAGCDAEEPQSEVGQSGEDAVSGELKFEDVFHVGR